MSEQEQFEKLMQFEMHEKPMELIDVPRWFLPAMCYIFPAWALFPLAGTTGDLTVPLIFTVLIGTSFLYYLRHRRIVSSFINQEKPLKTVLQDQKAHEIFLQNQARNNAPDAQIDNSSLSVFEEQHWQDIISSYEQAEPPKPQKRWGWKKKS